MAPIPLALPPALPAELLTYILTCETSPTTAIICQPQSTFLSSLFNSISRPAAVPDPADTNTIPPSSTTLPEPPKYQALLIPTLRQVAASRYTNLVFINTVTHLRAYLAAFPSPNTQDEPPETKQEANKLGDQAPSIVVFGLVGLHRDTSEWSAQGLGSSAAALVDAGWRTKRRIVVLEENVDSEDGQDGEGKRSDKVWEERLPMLNGNVRRAGLEGEDAVWSGRTVMVRRVLGRWFRFGKGS